MQNKRLIVSVLAGCALVVAAAGLQRATAQEDFAIDRLFGPLGITDYFWPRDPQGLSFGWAGLSLKPRDMAKIGYLYLRHGMWAGRQLLPPQWIETISHATVDMSLPDNPKFRYADQFWVRPDNARGHKPTWSQ